MNLLALLCHLQSLLTTICQIKLTKKQQLIRTLRSYSDKIILIVINFILQTVQKAVLFKLNKKLRVNLTPLKMQKQQKKHCVTVFFTLFFLLFLPLCLLSSSAGNKAQCKGEKFPTRSEGKISSRRIFRKHKTFKIKAGKTFNKKLKSSDRALSDGTPFDKYKYFTKKKKTIIIEMTSEDVDSYIILYKKKGKRLKYLAEDNDSGGNGNALLTYTIHKKGTYFIYANSIGFNLSALRSGRVWFRCESDQTGEEYGHSLQNQSFGST